MSKSVDFTEDVENLFSCPGFCLMNEYLRSQSPLLPRRLLQFHILLDEQLIVL